MDVAKVIYEPTWKYEWQYVRTSICQDKQDSFQK